MPPNRSLTSFSCRPRHRRGLTLVEVIAATALLTTLLTGTLLAQGRLKTQTRRTQARQAALDTIDATLHAWWAQDAVPRRGTGTVNGLRWRADTTPLDPPDAWRGDGLVPAVQVEHVRLTWSDSDATATAPPLLVIDLLLPPESIEFDAPGTEPRDAS